MNENKNVQTGKILFRVLEMQVVVYKMGILFTRRL